MSAWRFVLFDAPTRQPILELPCVGEVTLAEELNDSGSFKASIQMDQPINSPLTLALITPPRAVFAAERDGVLVWAGFIWTHEYDFETGVITLGGANYLSYLRRRVLRVTKHYTQWYQEDIIEDLINYVQSPGTFGNVGIVDKSTTSGVLRDRSYYWYERKNIGEILTQLAAVRGGFDFQFIPRWTNGINSELAVDFLAYYPPIGRETQLVFEAGASVSIPSATLDGTNLAYRFEAIGRGEGENTPIQGWLNSTLISNNLLLEAVESHTDVEHLSTLSDHAHRGLQRSKFPITIPAVETWNADLLNVVRVGDQVTYRIRRGIVNVDAIYRATTLETTVGEDGSERMALSLAPLEAFDAG